MRHIILLLIVLSLFVAQNSATSVNRKTCCGSVNHRPLQVNVRSIYNTPHQIQVNGADDRYWVSSVSSQGVEFPAFIAYPNPDPTGLQALLCLKQVEATAGGIGLNGRDDIIYYELSCAMGKCDKEIERYRQFIDSVHPKPALVTEEFTVNESPDIISLSTYEVAVNAIAFNKSAYDPDTDCHILYRALDATDLGVDNDPLYSHAIQNGDHIHTSLIVANDKTKSLADQSDEAWSNIMKILSLAGATESDIIMVNVYLRNMTDIEEIDLLYPNYLYGWKPPRNIMGPTGFPLPSQQGSLVGYRVIARTPSTNRCPNPIETFDVPEIYRYQPSLTSSGSTIGRFVYVGETYPTKFGEGLESIPTDPFYDPRLATSQAIEAMESIANRKGASREDATSLEIRTNKPLSYYLISSFGITDSYNWTRSNPPAYNLMGSSNAIDTPMAFTGVYWRNDENGVVDPSPYPWNIFHQYFGIDVPYCQETTLSTCPAPGWYYNSEPRTLNAALGYQGQGPRHIRSASAGPADLSILPPIYHAEDGREFIVGHI